jgi:1-acyl-sn-glycerol-3-phosphate acyltransferase
MRIISRLLLKLLGWRVASHAAKIPAKCVMIAAPHTSNWDFIIARAAFFVMGIPVKFTIKKEWMRFPFNLILKPLGAIPIDRSPKEEGTPRLSYTEAMIRLLKECNQLVVMVTPEGTRKAAPQWKTGFYYTALGAGVPIVLGYLDYGKKEAGTGPVIFPSGNVEEDMQTIMQFYVRIQARHPDKFRPDERYFQSS